MAHSLDMVVRGGGIVGKSLALLLARERFKVGLVEARTTKVDSEPAMQNASAVDVRSFALNTASKHLLESLACWPTGLAVTPIERMRVFGDGNSVVNFSANVLAWMVDASALEQVLLQAVGFQPQIQVNTAEQARLTVICEGSHSSTRERWGVPYQRHLYAQSALSARVLCELPHQQTASQWFAQGEVLALLPIQGPQGHEVTVVWSVAPEKAQQLQHLEASEFALQLQQACGNALGTMTLNSPRQVWPLQRACAEQWTGQNANADGAWALAGDAAHSVHPLAGQGLNLGLADVAELVKVLRERDYWRSVDDPKLLRRYERTRKGSMLLMDQGMDGLQWLFTQHGTGWERLRQWGMRGVERSPQIKQWLSQQAMNA